MIKAHTEVNSPVFGIVLVVESPALGIFPPAVSKLDATVSLL
jgi:hypothetical protein